MDQNNDSEIFKKIENQRRLSNGVGLLTGVWETHCEPRIFPPCPCQRQFRLKVSFQIFEKIEPKIDLFRSSQAGKGDQTNI